MEETANQLENSKKAPQLAPYQYKKGQSGNPSGRPKGILSMKEYARNMLASMTEEEREEFMHGLPKDIIWKMAEGNFKQDTEVKATIEDRKTLVIIKNGEHNKSSSEANTGV